mmetsp:Transcript_22767/g.52897  ORF Transcript_22767/g.52897 Transcript_22767/m.52897 type:complete len:278 (-) Transcript_22767:55-888(-)
MCGWGWCKARNCTSGGCPRRSWAPMGPSLTCWGRPPGWGSAGRGRCRRLDQTSSVQTTLLRGIWLSLSRPSCPPSCQERSFERVESFSPFFGYASSSSRRTWPAPTQWALPRPRGRPCAAAAAWRALRASCPAFVPPNRPRSRKWECTESQSRPRGGVTRAHGAARGPVRGTSPPRALGSTCRLRGVAAVGSRRRGSGGRLRGGWGGTGDGWTGMRPEMRRWWPPTWGRMSAGGRGCHGWSRRGKAALGRCSERHTAESSPRPAGAGTVGRARHGSP